MIVNKVKQYSALSFGSCDDHVTRLWIMSGRFLLSVLIILVPAYYFDTRLIDGAPLWAKPLKFALSLAIHFFTLAILAQQITRKYRTGIVWTLLGYAAVASMLVEQLYISIQASRGRRSHFNLETSFESSMYDLMGIGAVLLVTVSFVLGVMIWRYGEQRGLEKDSWKGLRLGSIIGLMAGSILTLIFAGYLSSRNSHLVGSVMTTSVSVPVLGWSRTVGDLRVPHFLATHLMQILPLVGFCCDWLKFPPRSTVIILALILVLLATVSFIFALSGKPAFPV